HGSGPPRTPECTMVEASAASANYHDLRTLPEPLVVDAAMAVGPQSVDDSDGGSEPCDDPLTRRFAGRTVDLHPPYTARTMVDLVGEHCDVDALTEWDDMPADAQR